MRKTMSFISTFERNARALSLRPAVGRGTAVTKVRWLDGYACEIEEGRWTLTADMGTKSGGRDLGPNPGVLGRGALGTCLMITYVAWAAKLGVELQDLEVEIHADYDSGAFYGTSDEVPGYTQLRYLVKVTSDAPEDEIRRFLDEADRHCAYLDNFVRPVDVRREVQIQPSITTPAETAVG